MTHSIHSPTRTKPIFGSSTDPRTQDAQIPKQRKTNHDSLAEFESDLCNLFVACEVSWNSANNLQTHEIAQKWLIDNVAIC